MDLLSKRSKKKMVDEGYAFVFDRNSAQGEKAFWRCEKKMEGCKARLHTEADTGAILLRLGHHDHDAEAAVIESRIAMNDLKRRAGTTRETTAQVINQVAITLSQAAQGQLPNIRAQRKTVQRVRQVATVAPANPRSLVDLDIPEEWTQYKRTPDEAVPFLLADSVDGADRILIFGTNQFADLLERAEHWYGDGTFCITPPLFSQVYTVLVDTLGGVVPVLYCLLPNKTEATYEKMFRMISGLRRCRPTQFSCDFEKAAITAVQNVFLGVEIFGCFFHLVKNLKKHIGYEGLMQRYNTDADFALQSRMISGLAFVPVPDLDEVLVELVDALPDELLPVLAYFEDTYVGRPQRGAGRRRPPIFPPETWTVYERTRAGDPRTNNHAEAAHRRIQCEIGMQHPTIWKFIEALRRVQKGRECFYETLVRGDAPPPKLRKYVQADTRILAIVNTYDQRTTLDYLRGLSHNFVMIQ